MSRHALEERQLLREELEQIWVIDRSEVIKRIYTFENHALVLKDEYYNMTGWPPGEAESAKPDMLACFDRGGWFHGLFKEGELIGVAVLDNCFIGRGQDLLQLKFLHLSRAWRKQGLGQHLFMLASHEAGKRGARGLYISATPSENTIRFYLNLGCSPCQVPVPALFALEPLDIHMECDTS